MNTTDFKYVTREKTAPYGKPKVYFCSHPQDFEIYFEQISQELLANQDCSIWYVNGEAHYDEDFFLSLGEMQLFVMPITQKLLCTENTALDIEFKFAVDNHIPVLPIMQERGLENLFNEKCGDLQFLDKFNKDITAISYSEKLKNYLSSVLIGDELAVKIRSAFDAYVFLSYRKKDRKYAQELMRLIHKNEFCRDIAIWYDEFLIPGENFNDAIKNALIKSDLFILAVTPNLVNETNYIMTTEYPMAKQERKPIFPAELIPTDREKLFEKYDDIPNPTNAHDKEKFTEKLLETVKRMAIKEIVSSPEHNFFIGLAYLYGIDVEVDRERAVSLITTSAEAGVTEAMEKLAEMYQTGTGVNRDMLDSLDWRLKLWEHYLDLYNDAETKDNLINVINSSVLLGDALKSVGMCDEAIETYEEALDFSEQLISYSENFRYDEWHSVIINRLLIIKMDGGCFSDAERYIDNLLGLDETIYSDDSLIKAIHYSNSAICSMHLRKYRKAHLLFDKTINLFENVTEINDDYIVALARAYLACGELYFVSADKQDEALAYCRKSIETLKKLSEENQALYFEDSLKAYLNMAYCFLSQNKLEDAHSVLKLCYDRLHTKQRNTNAESIYPLKAWMEVLIAMLYDKKEEELDTVEKHAARAIKIYEKYSFMFDNQNAFYDIGKVTAYMLLGTVYLEKDHFDDMLLNFNKAFEKYGELEEDTRRLFGSSFKELMPIICVYCLVKRQYSAALKYALTAVKLYISSIKDFFKRKQKIKVEQESTQ